MKYVEFFVDKIIHSEEHPDADFLFLKEERGEVTIPIIIGRTEGRVISIGLDKDSLFSIPLSYDVF